jgi:hypothetical protein
MSMCEHGLPACGRAGCRYKERRRARLDQSAKRQESILQPATNLEDVRSSEFHDPHLEHLECRYKHCIIVHTSFSTVQFHATNFLLLAVDYFYA